MNQVLAPVILNSFQDLFIKLNYNLTFVTNIKYATS
jgi:hypothetical protein